MTEAKRDFATHIAVGLLDCWDWSIQAMQRSIISGITGHLGREISRRLQKEGVQVAGLTRQSVRMISPPVGAPLFPVDGRTETLIRIFEKVQPDVVLHVAGCSRREHQSSDVEPFVTANMLLGIQLLECMRRTRCRYMVTAGTYLQHYDTDAYRAFNLYAATKQGFESVIEFYADTYDMSAVRLTLCDVYSEQDQRKKLMTDIVRAWKDNTPLRLADEHALVDPIHVEDAAMAFVRAAQLLAQGDLPHKRLSRYAVSSGENLTVRALLARFECLARARIRVTSDPSAAPRRITPRRGELVPGWTPQIDIDEGIRRIIASTRD